MRKNLRDNHDVIAEAGIPLISRTVPSGTNRSLSMRIKRGRNSELDVLCHNRNGARPIWSNQINKGSTQHIKKKPSDAMNHDTGNETLTDPSTTVTEKTAWEAITEIKCEPFGDEEREGRRCRRRTRCRSIAFSMYSILCRSLSPLSVSLLSLQRYFFCSTGEKEAFTPFQRRRLRRIISTRVRGRI